MNGEAHGDSRSRDKIKEFLKKKKLKIVFIASLSFGLVIFLMLLIFVAGALERIYPGLFDSSSTGVKTAVSSYFVPKNIVNQFQIHEYDVDDDNDGELDNKYELESAEDNNFYQEFKRQRYIWTDDYSGFGIAHSEMALRKFLVIEDFEDNDLDFNKILATIHFPSIVNSVSHFTDYNDEVDNMIVHGDVKLNEYEDEPLVYNRDTRDFYDKAKERLGSTFFLYPGVRLLMGNMISSKITYEGVKAAYWCDSEGCALTNSMDIVGSWSVLGEMYMKNETEYTEYFENHAGLGPKYASTKLIDAINYGAKYCINYDSDELENRMYTEFDWAHLSRDEKVWLKQNICNDYKLLISENIDFSGPDLEDGEAEYFSDYDFIEQVKKNLGLEDYEVRIPTFEYDENGLIMPTDPPMGITPDRKQEVLAELQNVRYISPLVKRYYNEKLFDKYLKSLYIPVLYTECENCSKNRSVDEIYNYINNLKDIYDKYTVDDTKSKHNSSTVSGSVNSGTILPANGKSANLPSEFNSQLVLPLNTNSSTQTSCFGYYDAIPGTKYYCYVHRGVDMVGSSQILSPADGVVSYCTTNKGSWGPYLEITHTLKDINGNNVNIISYYMHWLNKNGSVSCDGLMAGTKVTQGEYIAVESNQAGSHTVGTHLHFGLKYQDGTLLNPESYLMEDGMITSSGNGTTNCDEVRRICNEYCSTRTCTTA